MEEELEETPDKRKGWCHEKIPLRHVSVKSCNAVKQLKV